VPVMKDPSCTDQKFAVCQWPKGKKGMGYAIRSQRYRYVEWFEDWISTEEYNDDKLVGRELYDYETDPLETENLVDHPDYQGVVDIMKRQLLGFFEMQK